MPTIDTEGSPETSSGLFSSVFNFVSRELGSFIAGATGSPQYEEVVNQPHASSSRVKLPSRHSRRSDHDPYSSGKNRHDSTHRRRKKQHEGVVQPSGNKAHRSTEESDHAKKSTSHVRRSHTKRVDLNQEEHLSATDCSQPPRASRARPSIQHVSDQHPRSQTMPGSLFERSPAIPDDEFEKLTRNVRFSTVVRSQPPAKPEHDSGDESGSESSTTRQSRSRYRRHATSVRSSTQQALPKGSQASSPGKTVVQNVVEKFRTGEDVDPSIMLPRSPSRSPVKSPKKPEHHVHPRDISSEEIQTLSPKARGKLPALSPETSNRLRIEGKELELSVVKERHQSRIHNDAEDDAERTLDKQRIKALEEEIRRLKAELDRRSQDVVLLPPPPPPPPAPPPPPKIVFSYNHRGKEPTVAETDEMLSLARSSLRHTAPPTEEPINPLHGLGRAKRTGQPTVNIGADKMAAFLNEVKTHRLRKISNNADGSFVDQSLLGDRGFASRNDPRSRSLDGSTVPPLSVRIGASTSFTLGEKRKRTDDHHGPSLPAKRRMQLSNSLSSSNSSGNNTSFSRDDVTSISATRNPTNSTSQSSQTTKSNGSGRPIRAEPITSKHPSRTETDLTTPSLCSDNEGDQPSVEERQPSTPRILTAPVEINSKVEKERPQRGTLPVKGKEKTSIPEPGIRHPKKRAIRQPSAPVEPTHRHFDPPVDLDDIFSCRPPSSPKRLASPRKPQPPARSRPRSAQRKVVDSSDEEGVDDPLTLSPTNHADEHNDEQLDDGLALDARTDSELDSASGDSDGDISGFTKLHEASMNASFVLSKRHRRRSSGSISRKATPYRSTSRRKPAQRTLDEELRNSDDWIESGNVGEGADVLEEEVYSGVGTKSKSSGFLAHGGGGGIPVQMDTGRESIKESEDTSGKFRRSKRLSAGKPPGSGRKS